MRWLPPLPITVEPCRGSVPPRPFSVRLRYCTMQVESWGCCSFSPRGFRLSASLSSCPNIQRNLNACSLYFEKKIAKKKPPKTPTPPKVAGKRQVQRRGGAGQQHRL